MAVHTEDHPLEYLDFHGDIPKGNYGAGWMRIWDTGTYEVKEWEPKKLVVTLHGERVDNQFALFQAGRDAKNWLIHRMDPAPEGWEPLPEGLEPMRPSEGKRIPRNEDEWAYEIAWDGLRVLAHSEPGHLRLEHRRTRRCHGPVSGGAAPQSPAELQRCAARRRGHRLRRRWAAGCRRGGAAPGEEVAAPAQVRPALLAAAVRPSALRRGVAARRAVRAASRASSRRSS